MSIFGWIENVLTFGSYRRKKIDRISDESRKIDELVEKYEECKERLEMSSIYIKS